MDPIANLQEQDHCVANILRLSDACRNDGRYERKTLEDIQEFSVRLAELHISFAHWIARGGFDPRSPKIETNA